MSTHPRNPGTHTGRRQSEIFLVGWTDGGVTLEETDSYVILSEKPQFLNIFEAPSKMPEPALLHKGKRKGVLDLKVNQVLTPSPSSFLVTLRKSFHFPGLCSSHFQSEKIGVVTMKMIPPTPTRC